MISIVLLITVVVLFVILTFVWPPDSPWSPWWRTYKKTAIAANRLANVSNKDIVYELGSGDGEFIIIAAKQFHVKKAVGIEIDYVRHYISKIRIGFGRDTNIEFIRGNFFDVGLSQASVVYLYLVPRVLDKLIPKLRKELKSGTRIISYKYKMKLNLKKEDRKNMLYLYEV